MKELYEDHRRLLKVTDLLAAEVIGLLVVEVTDLLRRRRSAAHGC